ncbi:MAG TPA: GMC family oxidoreductase N-terminal domain-containing protein [Candidatus Dormibacteraeota bacterium]|jgi:5-(hydroxymethyl)furfural/furfural oxidase|nr:GMC family oxidoreductase N-terminal domain-containing protein [Candidatus Dormibacteraeota bacterium]
MSDREGRDSIVVGAGSARVLLLEAGPDFRSAETPAQFLTREVIMSRDLNPEFWWHHIPARRNPAQEPYPYSRAGARGGAPPSTGCAPSGACPRTTTAGRRGGPKAGPSTTSCPRSSPPRTTTTSATSPTTGAAARCRCTGSRSRAGEGLAFCEAALDAGYPFCPDHKAPGATGLCPFAMNIRDGRRVSTNDGYLEPARERPTLEIRGGCHVDTVLFDTRRRACGVRLAGGEPNHLAAGGEVVLSAGAVHSPAILMRSGIGPAGVLSRLGIEVICELPVGRGLQDHPPVLVRLETGGRPVAASATGSPTASCATARAWPRPGRTT